MFVSHCRGVSIKGQILTGNSAATGILLYQELDQWNDNQPIICHLKRKQKRSFKRIARRNLLPDDALEGNRSPYKSVSFFKFPIDVGRGPVRPLL